MSVTAALILMYKESHTSVSHVGGKGATANKLPGLTLQDYESANTIIDKDTKGGLMDSNPSCVKLQPNGHVQSVVCARVCALILL